MELTPEILGKKLRNARENRGLSQLDAATTLNIPRTAVSQIESGNRTVSTLELVKLAELYQQSVADFFSDTPVEEEEALVALHQVAPEVAECAEIDNHIAHCLAICRDGVALKKLLGRSLPELPSYACAEMHSPMDAIQQGTRVAEQERQRLNLGGAPISDITEVISNQGIWATQTELPEEMSGFFLRHRDIGMVIVVNLSSTRARQKFSYAHEYGHALMDREYAVTITSSRNSRDLIEIRANAFATAFLLPAHGVHEFLVWLDKGQKNSRESEIFDVATEQPINIKSRTAPRAQTLTYQDIAKIAHHFRTSYRATTYRLQNLKVISLKERNHLLEQEQYGREYLQFLKLDMTQEHDNLDPNSGVNQQIQNQVVYLAIEAYRRDEISRGRLYDIARSLNIKGKRLVALAGAACEDVKC